MKFMLSGVLIFVLLLSACGKKQEPRSGSALPSNRAAAPKYHCPMHPTYLSDRPGSCPICGMDLVPIEDAGAAGDAPSVSGRTTIFINPDRRAQIGLVTAPVEEKALTRKIRAPATIEWPETNLVQVSPRVGGWIQELYADFAGRKVEKNEPLFKLYSPELLATQVEYVNALKTGDAALIGAARRRLELWNISDDQIATLDAGGAPTDTMVIRSPVAGIIREKKAFKGMSFMPGEMLFEIADLSSVWVHAFMYEQDVALLRTGLAARVYVEAFPNRAYAATLGFIYPNVDEISRRIEVRFETENSDGELRADMWATVELAVDLGEAPTVPASALINTGRRYIAFVDRDDGHLEPREVRIGGRTEDDVHIRKGLAPGERVVTRALFLVDSESQLKAAIAGMTGSEHAH